MVRDSSSAAAVCAAALLRALAVSASALGSDSHELWADAPPTAAAAAAAGPPCMELSNAFGDHMVLQREPESAVVYGSVCGKLAGAKTVSVAIDGGAPTTARIAPGATTWEVKLPPTAASLKPHTLKISGGTYTTTLTDVLFGDSILCSGQSNMCFSLNQMTGATAEIELAGTKKYCELQYKCQLSFRTIDNGEFSFKNDDFLLKNGRSFCNSRYESIRLMTVTPTTQKTPQANLPKLMQNWSVANSESVGGGAANKSFSYFSAACWVQGRHLFDRLGGEVPIGLTTSAFGGTRVHAWSGPDALAACPQYMNGTHTISNSDLWNAMIVPLLPMRYKFMVWLQSESDVCALDDKCIPQRGGIYYACAIQAMIKVR